MNPNTIILGGLMAFAGAGVAWGAYEITRGVSRMINGIKEENREYGRILCEAQTC